MKNTLVAFLTALLVLAARAEVPTIHWSGQVRLRGELDNRDFIHGNALNSYGLSRIRLGARMTPLPNLSAFVQIQDSRIFGEEKDAAGAYSTLANTRNLDLHQGYLQVDSVFGLPALVRLGRMELKYGNERMIGAVDWNNVGRSFDGGLVRYADGRASADLFVMRVGENHVPPAATTPASAAARRDEGQTLYGAYGTIPVGDASAVDLYAFYQTNMKQTVPGEADLERATLGTYTVLAPSPFKVELEAAYQLGRQSTRDIGAYLLAATGTYLTGAPLVSGVRGSAEVLSGTPEGVGDARTFDPPFSTAHKFHGWMDYFITIPSNTYDRGLFDLNLGLNGALAPQLTYVLRAHNFSLMQSRSGEKSLGQEIDLLLSYRYAKPLGVDLGLSTFIPGPVERDVFGGSDAAFWGYLAVTIDL